MTKLLLIGVAAATIAAVSSANAAPPPPPPIPYAWTGCYVGAHVGFGTGYKIFSDAPGSNPVIDDTGGGASFTDGIFGGFGGGQAGCDYQFAPSYVIGVRGDFDAASISGSGIDNNDPSAPLQVNARIDSLFDIVGRLGYVPGPGVLLYVDGGVAWAHDSYSMTGSVCVTECTAVGYTQPSETRMGGVVGAGGELNLWGPWSAFAEYDHYFFGTKTLPFTCEGCEGPVTHYVNINQGLNTWRAGVILRFGGR